MELRFEKYEGLGNDFIVIDAPPHGDSVDEALAVRLCDRHRGIGADGVLIASIEDGRPRMRVINADGSRPEMCGNGLRCVAIHLLPRVNAIDWEIDTDAGPHRVRTKKFGEVEVAMRPPSLDPKDLPVASDTPLIDAPLTFNDGTTLHMTGVSMGNPHAVTFDALSEAERLRLGPIVGSDARFEEGVNVGFASLGEPTEDGRARILLHVFERGAGWTQACGTGACAAAVAAVETGRAARGEPIAVELPGGVLDIVVGEPGEPVLMTGPARSVFSGSITIY